MLGKATNDGDDAVTLLVLAEPPAVTLLVACSRLSHVPAVVTVNFGRISLTCG